MLRDKQYIEITPHRDSTKNSFSSEVRIEFTIPSNKTYVRPESFLLLRVNIAEEVALGAPKSITALSGDDVETGFIQNPACAFWDMMQQKINDVLSERIDEPTSTLTLLRLTDTDYSRNEKNFDGSPVIPLQGEFTVGDTTSNTFVYRYDGEEFTNATAGFGSAIQYQMYRILKTMQNPLANNDEYNFILYDPFIRSIKELDGGTKITMLFQVAPDWATKLLLSGGTAKTIIQNRLAPQAGTVDNRIYFEVQEIKYYAMMYERNNPSRSLNPEFIYDSVTPVIAKVTTADGASTNENIRLEVPVATNFITMVFKPNGNNVTSQQSYFNVPNVTERLTKLSILFGGLTYPQVPFEFGTGIKNGGADSYRAYNDFLVGTNMLENVGSIMTYREWLKAPIFVWRVVRPSGDMSTTLTLKLSFGAAAGTETADVMLSCYSTHKLAYDIDDNGLTSNTRVSTISV
jgi:hypothetical protein